jgi:YVTN family beta-propeller protein
MKKLSMILTVLFIFGSSAIGHTSDECVVFEGTFEMSTRRPVAQFKHFQALNGEAILKVYDESNGHHNRKVSSAIISVNGKKVVRYSDFSKKKFFHFWRFWKKKFYHYPQVENNDDTIEKTVDLTKGQNYLGVVMNGRRGEKMRVVIAKPKYLATDDPDCDLIASDGDQSGSTTDNPCRGGNTELCDDNCPNDFNPDQADSNGNGIGDVCDAGDTYPDLVVATVPVGVGPYGGIAVSPDGAFVYVTNYGTKTYPGTTVSVINTADNTMRDTIPVGKYPFGISMTPDGKFAYVSNYGDNSVSVIDTDPDSVDFNQVITTISVGLNGPFGISLTPDGAFAYVDNYTDGTVSVIKTLDNSVLDPPITVGLRPFGISVTPNGEFAYVSNFGNGIDPGTVSVIDTDPASDKFNQVIATITVGIGASGVSVTPNGEFVYVTNLLGNSVSVIETSTNQVKTTITVGTWPDGISVTPNGAYVYVNNYTDGTVSVIKTHDNSLLNPPITVGTGPHGGIAVSPDGQFVYVANYGDGTVSVIGYDAP